MMKKEEDHSLILKKKTWTLLVENNIDAYELNIVSETDIYTQQKTIEQ